MNFIIDDSYFSTNKSVNTDNATIIACVQLPAASSELIINIFEDVMTAYGLRNQPLKHCLDGGLHGEYKLRNQDAKYHILRKKHSVIINELLKKTSSIDYQLLASWNYVSLDNNVKIGKQKLQNTSDCFINVITEASHSSWPRSILSDRFEENQQSIINKRFSLWTEEALEKTPLTPLPEYYTGCSFHSRLLQFADIVVGIMRNMIQGSVKGDPIFAPHCAHIIPKLVGYPNKISEKGLLSPPEYQEVILSAISNTAKFTKHLPKFME